MSKAINSPAWSSLALGYLLETKTPIIYTTPWNKNPTCSVSLFEGSNTVWFKTKPETNIPSNVMTEPLTFDNLNIILKNKIDQNNFVVCLKVWRSQHPCNRRLRQAVQEHKRIFAVQISLNLVIDI